MNAMDSLLKALDRLFALFVWLCESRYIVVVAKCLEVEAVAASHHSAPLAVVGALSEAVHEKSI